MSPISPGAHTSPLTLQPKQIVANEQASCFTSVNSLVPFSGSSFLLSSDPADGDVLERAHETQSIKSAEFHQSQLQSKKAISTHKACTWQQPEMTFDLSKPEHVIETTAVISLSCPMLNDDSNIKGKLMTEAGQAEQIDTQKE